MTGTTHLLYPAPNQCPTEFHAFASISEFEISLLNIKQEITYIEEHNLTNVQIESSFYFHFHNTSSLVN